MSRDKDDRPVDRRRFFREGLRRLISGVADSVESVQGAIESAAEGVSSGFDSTDKPPAGASDFRGLPSIIPPGVYLRPPGALPEAEFRRTCSRGGDCVRACPVNAIRLDPGLAGGVPRIDPEASACVVCASLACMHACPSGALTPTPMFHIRMGTAVWREELCVRTVGEECRACVERCPMGTAAIDIVASRVTVNPHGCVGCGVCQQVCPTRPRSIVVIPAGARNA